MKKIKAIINFIQKNDLSIAISLFTIVFLISFLPFFIYIPIPAIGWDTYDYFWMAEKFFNAEFPIKNLPSDFPVGFPLFLTLCKMLSMNIIHIALMQTVIFYLACVYLIFQISGLFKNASVSASISLCFFVLQPLIMRNTVTLYPDSLYGTSLIFITGSIFRFYIKKDIFSYVLILLGIFFSILIRSNGIFLLYIPLVIIAWALIKKRMFTKTLICFVLMLLLQSSVNLIIKGYFFPGEMRRISQVYKNVKSRFLQKNIENENKIPANSKNSKRIIDIAPDGTTTFLIMDTTKSGRPILQIRYTQTRKVMYKQYAQSFIRTKPSFYYSLMPATYNSAILNKQQVADSVLFDGYYFIDDFAPTLKNFMYKSFSYSKFLDKKYPDVIDYKKSGKKILMLLSHYAYQLIDKIKLNVIIYMFFWLLFIFAVYQSIFKKTFNRLYIILILTSSIYLVHLILLPIIHERVQERYLFVTEFVIYLNVFIGLSIFISEIRRTITLKKSTTN